MAFAVVPPTKVTVVGGAPVVQSPEVYQIAQSANGYDYLFKFYPVNITDPSRLEFRVVMEMFVTGGDQVDHTFCEKQFVAYNDPFAIGDSGMTPAQQMMAFTVDTCNELQPWADANIDAGTLHEQLEALISGD